MQSYLANEAYPAPGVLILSSNPLSVPRLSRAPLEWSLSRFLEWLCFPVWLLCVPLKWNWASSAHPASPGVSLGRTRSEFWFYHLLASRSRCPSFSFSICGMGIEMTPNYKVLISITRNNVSLKHWNIKCLNDMPFHLDNPEMPSLSSAMLGTSYHLMSIVVEMGGRRNQDMERQWKTVAFFFFPTPLWLCSGDILMWPVF